MRYHIRTITDASAITPLFDVDAARLHLHVDEVDEDSLIAGLVLASQEHIENFTSQLLTTRVLELTLDRFPASDVPICLPRAPITGVVSVKYTDVAGLEQTMDSSDYRWNDFNPEVVLPAFGDEWPSAVADESGAVRICFSAGYAADKAPFPLVAATKLLLGHLYANRESVVIGQSGQAAIQLPDGVERLCAKYRRPVI